MGILDNFLAVLMFIFSVLIMVVIGVNVIYWIF